MKKGISFPLASLLAGAISVAPVAASSELSSQDLASAFSGGLSESPVALNQTEMKETEGEWGWVVRVAAFLVGAGVRAPQPVHAPGVPGGGCSNAAPGIVICDTP